MTNSNFRWLTYDIDNSIVLKVVNELDDRQTTVYNVLDVLEVDGDKIDVKTANIDDLTNLLTIGIVRFANVNNQNDILDIPFRNLYKLYESSSVLGNGENKYILSSSLDCFAVISGKTHKLLKIFPVLIRDISDDLKEVIKIAYSFGSYGMQEKFDALSEITMINHRRLLVDRKGR